MVATRAGPPANTTTGVVVATNHVYATWALTLLEDFARLQIWHRPRQTICIHHNITAHDMGILSRYCRLVPTRFRFDRDYDFVKRQFKHHLYWTPPPRRSPGSNASNPLVPYRFATAWDRVDIILEPLFREFAKIIYLDVDHLVVAACGPRRSTVWPGLRSILVRVDPPCVKAGRPFDMEDLSSGSFPLALPRESIGVKPLSRYREFFLELLANASIKDDFRREFPVKDARPGEGVFSNRLIVYNMTAIPSPEAMKRRVLSLFHHYGPQVSRWGEQGFFQMLFWNRVQPINSPSLFGLVHLYGVSCQLHLDNVTGQCPRIKGRLPTPRSPRIGAIISSAKFQERKAHTTGG